MRRSSSFWEFVEDIVLSLIIGVLLGAVVFFAVVYYRGYQDGHSKELVSKTLVEFVLGRDLENPLDKLQPELTEFEAPVKRVCEKEEEIANSDPSPARRLARRQLADRLAEVEDLIDKYNEVAPTPPESLPALKTRFC